MVWEFLEGVMPTIWSGVTWAIIIFIALVVIIALGLFALIMRRRKKWNLKVEFKLPRSDGRFVNAEWGKGHYNTRTGVVSLKRKGMKTVGMKPFDIKKYLQGINILTAVQLGPEDYRPVLPDSFTVFKNPESGHTRTVLELETDTGEHKTWLRSFEREAKKAFSLEGIWEKYQGVITLGIVVFIIFLGFAILWVRLPTICGA